MLNLLTVTWDVNPFILTIGDFGIRWYSLFFVAGIFPIGYWIMRSFYRREGLPTETLDPWKILMTREGGLASHGGAIGVLLAMWWYVHKYGRKYGFGYIQIIDRLVIPVCFAGMMIRLGNLMNSEIYGTYTDLPWGFIFVRDPWGDGLPHHPTQIYEALSYCILGLILLWLYRTRLDRLRTGTIFGIFLIVLFGMRFLIEFIKEDQSDFEAGMVLKPFILTGILLLIWSARKGGPARIQNNTIRHGANQQH